MKPVSRRFAAALSIVLLTCLVGGCLDQSRVTPPQLPPPTYAKGVEGVDPKSCSANIIDNDITAEAGFVRVGLNVESAKGAPLRLKREDLKLFAGESEIPVRSFAKDPSTVGILIDTSGSMANKIPQIKAAISQFVNELDPKDELYVFAFSSQPFLLQPFTTRHQPATYLSLLYAQGQTAMYDTMIDGILMAQGGCDPHKALFVITDGEDNSSKWRENDVASKAAFSHIGIYSIGIGEPATSVRWSGPFNLDYGTDKADMTALNNLAAATGAQAYNVPLPGDVGLFKKDASAIADEIDNRYVLGFISDKTAGPLRLQIRNHPGITVKTNDRTIEVVETETP